MLKRFFGNVLSSFMGAWLAMMFFGFCAFLMIIAIIASFGGGEMGEVIKSKSILELCLEGEIVETKQTFSLQDFNPLSGGMPEQGVLLRDIIDGLAEARVNEDIKVLYIHCKGVAAAPATLKAVREAVLDFKKSGKKVIAYGDSYSQGDYYVASAADKVYLNKVGSVGLSGMHSCSLYLKELFDKVGIHFQVFKVGTYKSAVEPYLYNEMSEPARAQLDTLYNNIWSALRDDIAKSRGMKTEQINALVSDSLMMFRSADFAKSVNLVDSVIYQRNIDEILAAAVDEDKDDLNFVSPSTMAAQSKSRGSVGSKNQVAVIYAVGEIAENAKNGIDCYTLVPLITELADDDNVKAVVLRVNSPGGSVFGSDQIADALDYIKQKGKPFVVSMGDYAASGGYWISCQADRIFADPLTITGSIGIFGLIPEASELMKKIGVSPQFVATDPNAAVLAPFKAFNEVQTVAMQREIERGYDNFLSRVAKGRNMTKETVDRIGQGRVWDGQTALKLKLVDELGSLQAAIDYAAKKAKISGKENVVCYPETEPNFMEILQSLNIDATYMKLFNAYGTEYSAETLDLIRTVLNRKPQQALMMPINVKL